MASVTDDSRLRRLLDDPGLKEKLQDLRRTDNVTNLWYLARTYLLLTVVIGGTLWFYQWRVAASWSAWWHVPVTFLATQPSCVNCGCPTC